MYLHTHRHTDRHPEPDAPDITQKINTYTEGYIKKHRSILSPVKNFLVQNV